MKGEPIFGDSEWVQTVRKNESRDYLKDNILAILDQFGDDLTPFEVGGVIYVAAALYYADSDVNDIHEFIRGAKGDPENLALKALHENETLKQSLVAMVNYFADNDEVSEFVENILVKTK